MDRSAMAELSLKPAAKYPAIWHHWTIPATPQTALLAPTAPVKGETLARKMQRLAAFPAAPRLSILASIAAILFLSACAFDPSTIVRTPRTPEAAEAGAKGSDAQPGDAGTKAAQELPPEVTDAFEKPEQIAAVEIDLTNFKERLLGLDDQEITERLGKPKFERNEPPARIWQYQSNECFVDLFLFSQDGDITVDHVEVRGKQVEKIDEKVCFASILNAANDGEKEGEKEDSKSNSDDRPDSLGGDDTDDAAPKKSEKTEAPEKDELPDAPKIGTTQADDDLLEEPAP